MRATVYVATVTMGEYSDTGHAVVGVTRTLELAIEACKLFECYRCDPHDDLSFKWNDTFKAWLACVGSSPYAYDTVQFTIQPRPLGD